MKLWALSDVHVGYAQNREALEALPPRPDDWLIVAGDVGETAAHLELTFTTLGKKFKQLIWVPGNHELWSRPDDSITARGEARYLALVELARRHGVLTPEDPYVRWDGEGGAHTLVPMFLLYDYSFRPSGVSRYDALEWAAESGVMCADEQWLSPEPYPSRDAWCEARCRATAARLERELSPLPTVLINHFPLKHELVYLPAVPRFSIWCGTTRTEDWHRRFRARVVVSGHLHLRRTDWIDGVRFEEVSLGYPRQWRQERGAAPYLREILPGPPPPRGV